MTTAAYLPVDQGSIPPPAVMEILEGRVEAMNRGDGDAAAAYYAVDASMAETDLGPNAITRGRENIAKRLRDLYEMGLRLEPAGVPIAYDRYVAEPVTFTNANGPGNGAGMLVFEFGPDDVIEYQWVIGWVDCSGEHPGGGAPRARPPRAVTLAPPARLRVDYSNHEARHEQQERIGGPHPCRWRPAVRSRPAPPPAGGSVDTCGRPATSCQRPRFSQITGELRLWGSERS
jgi:hypothetical protein